MEISLLVRRLGEAKKVKAKVEHISHELDLALLSADTSFFGGISPLKINVGEPHLSDVVFVVGYPEGGKLRVFFRQCCAE